MFYTGNSVQAVPLHQLKQFPDVIGMASALHLFSLQLIGFTLWITEREREIHLAVQQQSRAHLNT
jgi:hypothetical protein